MRQRVVDSKWRATTSLVNKKSSHAIFLRLRFFAPRYTNDGRFALLSYDNEIPNLPKKAKNWPKMAQKWPKMIQYCQVCRIVPQKFAKPGVTIRQYFLLI